VTTRDDELLDALAVSLGPAPDAEPTWAEISQLHRVIDSMSHGRRPARTPLWRFRRPLAAAVAGFVVLGGASAAAAVSGAVMPQPVRVAARAVGLPVESPHLAGARAAMAHLRAALARQPRDLDAIRARAQEARDRLERLSADDRAHVEAEAAFLLGEADAALAPPPLGLGSPPPRQPTASSGGQPVAAPPNAAPIADDHGPNQAGDDQNRGRVSADRPSGDDNPTSSVGGGDSGSSGPSGDGGGDHTATTQHVDNSGPGSCDGCGGTSGGGSSHDGGGGSDGGSRSGSDGGGHSGPG
jgi:hypothetical protein